MDHSNQLTVGKWEERVWMVCFWITFMALLWQLFWMCQATWGLFQNRNGIPAPFSGRFVWWFAALDGFIIDNLAGVLLAPLALYAFAKARTQGLSLRWPFTIWLISHLVLTTALLVCFAMLWLERVAGPPMLIWTLPMRVFVNNGPLIALLAAFAAIYFLPKGNLDPPAPAEPIDPLA